METFQHAVVTLVALIAGVVLLRRVLGLVERGGEKTGCEKCPSGEGVCGTTTPVTTAAIVEHPLVLIGTSAHARRQTGVRQDRPSSFGG